PPGTPPTGRRPRCTISVRCPGSPHPDKDGRIRDTKALLHGSGAATFPGAGQGVPPSILRDRGDRFLRRSRRRWRFDPAARKSAFALSCGRETGRRERVFSGGNRTSVRNRTPPARPPGGSPPLSLSSTGDNGGGTAPFQASRCPGTAILPAIRSPRTSRVAPPPAH